MSDSDSDNLPITQYLPVSYFPIEIVSTVMERTSRWKKKAHPFPAELLRPLCLFAIDKCS